MNVDRRLRLNAAPLISLVLLAGIWADRQLFHFPDGDASAYHARVRASVDLLPDQIGDWLGSDAPLPRPAAKLLKPNAIKARRFVNFSTRERASLAIIQCGDTRDMRAHYPPVCYPARGWTLSSTRQSDFKAGGIKIPATVYRFTMKEGERYASIVV